MTSPMTGDLTGELVAAGFLLLLYAAAVMVVTPPLVTRRRWTSRLPRTALLVWVGAVGSGAVAMLASLGCAIWAATTLSEQQHRQVTLDHVVDGLGITLGACLMTAVGGGVLCAALYRAVVAATSRRRVRAAVALAAPATEGRPRGRAAARRTPPLVVHSEEATAISVPGRKPVIMVSTRLQETLTPAQLEAVVEHERGHLLQRHHLLLQLADLQYRCAPALPCARSLERSVHLLVELAADDHAAQRCGYATTATALRTLGGMTGDRGLDLRATRLERRGARVEAA